MTANGELTFGGTDTSRYTGSITYTPLTIVPPANQFWGIDQSVRYGANTVMLPITAGIVDTGTSLLLLSTDAFSRYQAATGAILDASTGLLSVTSAQLSAMQSLFFTIGSTTFEFTVNAQLFPRSANTQIGGTANGNYLIVGSLGTPSGEGLDFINGYVFLERFYTILDTTNRRVGFATTPLTTATTNEC